MQPTKEPSGFHQSIDTRSTRNIRTVLIYGFTINLLTVGLVTFIILGSRKGFSFLQTFYIPLLVLLGGTCVLEWGIITYYYQVTPKIKQLTIDSLGIRLYNEIGLKKGYVRLPWSTITAIRPVGEGPRAIEEDITRKKETATNPQTYRQLEATKKIAVTMDRMQTGLITKYNGVRLANYAALTNETAYVFVVLRERREEFISAVLTHQRYNPMPICFSEVFSRRKKST